MKIIHVSHLYHPSQGGVQFFFKNVSERLVRDYGDDVTVVTTNSIYGPERSIFKKIEPAQEVINGVKVLRFSFKRDHISLYRIIFKIIRKLGLKIPDRMILKASGPYSPAMKKYLMSVQADAICASSSTYYYMQLPLWRKCNFFYHGSIHWLEDETERSINRIQVAAIKASTLYFANTAYEKYRLEKLGVNPNKIYVLGLGVDANLFVAEKERVAAFRQKLSIATDAIVIGYVGRIERPKNVLQVIKSFIELAEKNDKLYLVVAGSANTYAAELKEYCNKFSQHITQRIIWKENFALEEKPLIFNALDIFVLPSHNESFGIVFLEAWSCKKPVIGVAIGAVRNVINENVDGLLMEIDDDKSLSQQLLRLINDEQLRKSLGENGYNKVKHNFTWDVMVSRMRQCYVDALPA